MNNQQRNFTGNFLEGNKKIKKNLYWFAKQLRQKRQRKPRYNNLWKHIDHQKPIMSAIITNWGGRIIDDSRLAKAAKA